MSVDRAAKLALLDLQKLNRKVLSCTTYIASVNVSNPRCMAVRINSSDYHFMSRTSFRGGIWWSFKSGKTGPTFRILNQMGPNSIEWKQYTYNGNNWVDNSNRYIGTIYYLVYK